MTLSFKFRISSKPTCKPGIRSLPTAARDEGPCHWNVCKPMSTASHRRRFRKLPSVIVSMPDSRPLHRVVRQMITRSSRPELSTTARLQSGGSAVGLCACPWVAVRRRCSSDAALDARRNALAVTACVLRKWSALKGERLYLRIGPLPVWMPDLYRRSIEPQIAIVLSIGRAVALPAIAAHLGRFLPRLGPLVATQAAFLFVCTHMELNRRLVDL